MEKVCSPAWSNPRPKGKSIPTSFFFFNLKPILSRRFIYLFIYLRLTSRLFALSQYSPRRGKRRLLELLRNVIVFPGKFFFNCESFNLEEIETLEIRSRNRDRKQIWNRIDLVGSRQNWIARIIQYARWNRTRSMTSKLFLLFGANALFPSRVGQVFFPPFLSLDRSAKEISGKERRTSDAIPLSVSFYLAGERGNSGWRTNEPLSSLGRLFRRIETVRRYNFIWKPQ